MFGEMSQPLNKWVRKKCSFCTGNGAVVDYIFIHAPDCKYWALVRE